jgi:hypothetical protein
MGDFQATTTVTAAEGALFDYLSQVQNLPHHFGQMTSAEPGDGEQVHTTARLPDGQQVDGETASCLGCRDRPVFDTSAPDARRPRASSGSTRFEIDVELLRGCRPAPARRLSAPAPPVPRAISAAITPPASGLL